MRKSNWSMEKEAEDWSSRNKKGTKPVRFRTFHSISNGMVLRTKDEPTDQPSEVSEFFRFL